MEEETTTTDKFTAAVTEAAEEVGVDPAKLEAVLLDKLEPFLNFEEEKPEEEEPAFDAAAIAAKARNA